MSVPFRSFDYRRKVFNSGTFTNPPSFRSLRKGLSATVTLVFSIDQVNLKPIKRREAAVHSLNSLQVLLGRKRAYY